MIDIDLEEIIEVAADFPRREHECVKIVARIAFLIVEFRQYPGLDVFRRRELAIDSRGLQALLIERASHLPTVGVCLGEIAGKEGHENEAIGFNGRYHVDEPCLARPREDSRCDQ